MMTSLFVHTPLSHFSIESSPFRRNFHQQNFCHRFPCHHHHHHYHFGRGFRHHLFQLSSKSSNFTSISCCTNQTYFDDDKNNKDKASSSTSNSGHITLLGCGPCDAKHLTQAGIKALENADVVLYDRLIDEDVLKYATSSKSKSKPILKCVGKSRDNYKQSIPQSMINEKMIMYAKQGLNVVRVKGGDSVIFGRLASELHIIRSQISTSNVEVIPGITTASAVAALLQFPLTSIGNGGGVCLVSGHENINWITRDLITHVTLVVYMGLKEIGALLTKLAIENDSNDNDEKDISAVAVQGLHTQHQKNRLGFRQHIGKKIESEQLKVQHW